MSGVALPAIVAQSVADAVAAVQRPYLPREAPPESRASLKRARRSRNTREWGEGTRLGQGQDARALSSLRHLHLLHGVACFALIRDVAGDCDYGYFDADYNDEHLLPLPQLHLRYSRRKLLLYHAPYHPIPRSPHYHYVD